MLEGTEDEADDAVLHDFLTQFYDEAAHIPKEVLLPHEVEEARIIEQWLKEKRSTKVSIKVPQRGKKKELVQMAATNAADTLNTLRQQWAADRSKHVTAMNELREALDLERPPSRIEGYDISHTQGAQTVGSMVVFVQGAPRKTDYRRFNVQTVGNDDYGAMKEVLTRRFQRYADTMAGELHDTSQIGKLRKDTAWALLPDLLIVDGGKGQLSMAEEVLREFALEEEVPLAGLAKQEEELFVSGRRNSQFGCPAAQKVSTWSSASATRPTASPTPDIANDAPKWAWLQYSTPCPESGPRRRRLLLEQFGSLDGIRQTLQSEEIAATPGIPFEVAQAVKAHLR